MTRPDQTRPVYAQKSGLEWIALAFLLFAGVVLSFLTPYFQIPDEDAHLHRAYQISEAKFISPLQERDLDRITFVASTPRVFFQPQYVEDISNGEKRYSFDDIAYILSEPLNDTERDFEFIPNTGQYPPIAYFPQAIAAFIVRSLGGTAGQIYYAMRIGAVLFVALCIFGAIRVLPEKGLLLFLISMMPMFLAEMASVSADASVYGICIFASAYLLSLTRDEEALSRFQMLVILFLSVAVGLSKQIYGTVMLLYFLMPYQKLGNRRRYILFGLLVLAACLVSSLAWTYISMIRLHAVGSVLEEANPAEQMKFIIAHPLRALLILVKSNMDSIMSLVFSFIGCLGWLTLMMPGWFYRVYPILLLTAAFCGKLKLSIWHRMIMLLGSLATLLAIDIYEYLTWTPPGASEVAGLQGRYFIPIALMSLSFFSCLPRIKYEKIIAIAVGLMSVVTTIWSTYSFFYA